MVDLNMLVMAAIIKHPFRDVDEPLKPPVEPLVWEEGTEPGYYSLVPNHRCFQCKDVPNHRGMNQRMIHYKLLADVDSMPCRDCHNHEMRHGEKFYERVFFKKIGEHIQ